MKRPFLLCLLFCILLPSIVFAGQKKIVTSETLKISDIESYIIDPLLKQTGVQISIIGIHQNKNSATIYFQNKGQKPETYTFIRFNSGKWYHPLFGRFVQKIK